MSKIGSGVFLPISHMILHIIWHTTLATHADCVITIVVTAMIKQPVNCAGDCMEERQTPERERERSVLHPLSKHLHHFTSESLNADTNGLAAEVK